MARLPRTLNVWNNLSRYRPYQKIPRQKTNRNCRGQISHTRLHFRENRSRRHVGAPSWRHRRARCNKHFSPLTRKRDLLWKNPIPPFSLISSRRITSVSFHNPIRNIPRVASPYPLTFTRKACREVKYYFFVRGLRIRIPRKWKINPKVKLLVLFFDTNCIYYSSE